MNFKYFLMKNKKLWRNCEENFLWKLQEHQELLILPQTSSRCCHSELLMERRFCEAVQELFKRLYFSTVPIKWDEKVYEVLEISFQFIFVVKRRDDGWRSFSDKFFDGDDNNYES